MRVKGLRHADLTQRAQRATTQHGQRADACVTTSGALTIAIANTYRPQPTNPQTANAYSPCRLIGRGYSRASSTNRRTTSGSKCVPAPD